MDTQWRDSNTGLDQYLNGFEWLGHLMFHNSEYQTIVQYSDAFQNQFTKMIWLPDYFKWFDQSHDLILFF